MRVLDHDIDRRPAEVELDLGADYRDLEDLLRESDSVSLHVSFTPQTRQLINVRRLALMKPTAVLVNTSRSPVIDEPALARALSQGQTFPRGLLCSSEAADPSRIARLRQRCAPPTSGISDSEDPPCHGRPSAAPR
jgi:D-isomer specific 2-hydroxyacid dehydrogenase, NAD binding domain